jgi:hypothetical protein
MHCFFNEEAQMHMQKTRHRADRPASRQAEQHTQEFLNAARSMGGKPCA